MPTRYITAVKMGPGAREEHIERCLTLAPGSGKTLELSPKSIAELVLENGHTYAVGSPDGAVEVEGVKVGGKPHHIRTVKNGVRSDNLLQLPKL